MIANHNVLRLARKVILTISRGGAIRTPGKLMRKMFIKRDCFVEIDDFDGQYKLILNLREHMQSRIFWLGYYNNDIVPLLDRLLKPGMTVIDVGANIGEISLVAARRVGCNGNVIAFEPLTRLADELEHNVVRNSLHWVQVVRAGLADFTGAVPIYLAHKEFNDGTQHDGLGTLYPTEERGLAIETVQITCLDTIAAQLNLESVDLIKIDIEGAELPCLKGSSETIRRYLPFVIIEVQAQTAGAAGYEPADLYSFFEAFGYKFHRIGRGGVLAEIEQDAFQNVLCIPPGRKA